MNIEAALRALASERRLQILEWLKEPVGQFPPQTDGDLVKDGVCGLFIAQKLNVSQPQASISKSSRKPVSLKESASSSGPSISGMRKVSPS
jgi:hypothetical protein